MANKQIPISVFKYMKKQEIMDIVPVDILFDGELLGVFSKKSDVVVIGDLHPRIQIKFRAMEEKVRAGMPPPIRIDYQDEN